MRTKLFLIGFTDQKHRSRMSFKYKPGTTYYKNHNSETKG